MPTEAKRAAVAELREQLASSRTLIVSEYRGLTVSEIGEIRRSLRKQDVTLQGRQEPAHEDRRLRYRAARRSTRSSSGRRRSPSASDETRTAKAVIDTMRPFKQVRITGALLGDRAIDADGVTRLAALPSREVLLAQLAGAFAVAAWPRPPACSTRRCATSPAWSRRSPTSRAAA